MRLNFRFFSIVLLISGISSNVIEGQTNEFLIKQADGFFQNRQFAKALLIYQQLQRSQPQEMELLLKRSIAEYETNNLDTATALIQRFLKKPVQDKTNLAQYLYGKILMSKKEYAQAAASFKISLLNTPVSSELYKRLIDEIKRCGSGDIIQMSSSEVLVESAGNEVNTIWDEINPIPSINTDSRIYFNSNRESVSAPGNTGASYELPFDMYASNLTNGEWSDISPLNSTLTTKEHELLSGFDEKGRVVYYKQGDRLDHLVFLTDTFNQAGVRRSGSLAIEFLQSKDEIFYFNDTILLFSSERPGGFGGTDLYYSMNQTGTWSLPVNLGKSINTPYDEVCPYLAFDGRTLLFSSNNTHSIGGFDFFSAFFDDKTKQWSTPANLGLPLNSSEDEKYFKLNKNRLGGLFASNRKSGKGGYDIYFAYFNQAWVPQLERSRPVFFGQVNLDPGTRSNKIKENASNIEVPVLRTITPPVVFYESDDQLALPSVTKKLDEVSLILSENVNLNVIIEVFSNKANQTLAQNILFSIKRAEALKGYFTQHGVKPSQLYLKGYGSNFPIAAERINDQSNPAGESLNKRIEFTFFQSDPGMESAYLQVKEPISVNLIIKTPELEVFRSGEKGLNYKTLLISASNSANLESYIKDTCNSFFIEKNNITGKYDLMSGTQKEYLLAKSVRKEWITKGFEDAMVVAYIDNVRITANVLPKWAEKFPDLINYIYRSE